MKRLTLLLLWMAMWAVIGLTAFSFLAGCGMERWEVISNTPDVKDPDTRYVVCKNNRGECEAMFVDARVAKLYPVGFTWWQREPQKMLPYLKENGK